MAQSHCPYRTDYCSEPLSISYGLLLRAIVRFLGGVLTGYCPSMAGGAFSLHSGMEIMLPALSLPGR